TLFINAKMKNKIPKAKDTYFAIFSKTFFGQKYVSLVFNKDRGEPFIQNNDYIDGLDPISFDQMILSFSHWFQGKTPEEVLENVKKQYSFFLYQLAALKEENEKEFQETIRLAKISIASLTNSFARLKNVMKSINDPYQKPTKNNSLKTTLDNLIAVSSSIEKMNKALKMGRGNIGKFMKDKRFYRELNAAIYFSKVFFRCIRERPVVLLYREPCPG
ncbi:MAG: hypothetical protein D6767_02555, partial [Candidatus Hydrogenedentota bacterium]